MNDIDIKLIGDKDLLKILNGLDDKVKPKVLKKVLSDSASIYVKEAKKKIPVRKTKIAPPSSGKRKAAKKTYWHPAGLGKKSPMKKYGKSKTPTVFVGPKAGEKGTRTDTFYLRFWEEGTKKMAGRWGFRNTYNENRRNVENNIFNSMRKIIEREIKRFAKR